MLFNPWLSADAMVGQAAVARRLGDLARARTLLDAAGSQYRQRRLSRRPAPCARGLAWWALAAGRLGEAAVFAADAAEGAAASGDPATQLLADTAVAAVKAAAEPTRHQHRSLRRARSAARQGVAYRSRSLTDEPDVAALAARLARRRLSGPSWQRQPSPRVIPPRSFGRRSLTSARTTRRSSGNLPPADLSITSAPPQRTRATLPSCSQRRDRTPATMTTWPLPGQRLTSTAVWSPQTSGPLRDTGRHSAPPARAGLPRHCGSPSTPTRPSGSPSPTSTPSPERRAKFPVTGR